MPRDPKFKDPNELEALIDEYFEKGANKRTFIIGKGKDKEVVELPVFSITGLALFLGFASRQSLYDYGKREKYSYIIKKAQTLIERLYEENLQHGNTTGAIFALKNMGWRDVLEQTVTNIKPLTPEEIEEAKNKFSDEI